jgi:hypothetical protein
MIIQKDLKIKKSSGCWSSARGTDDEMGFRLVNSAITAPSSLHCSHNPQQKATIIHYYYFTNSHH